MAGSFGNAFKGSFGGSFKGGTFKSSSSSSNPDEVFQKQLASMAQTLSKAGIKTKEVDQRTWLEKMFSVLNTPLALTTSMTSAALGPKTVQEALQNTKDTFTGKKAYGTSELLEEAFGKSDKFGRKAAAFALGIPMDPLTWLPLSKLTKPALKAASKGIRSTTWGANKLDDVARISSDVKKFFGYDDLARFAGQEEVKDAAGKIIKEYKPDLREQYRQLKQLVGSGTARKGLNIDKYMEANSGLQKLLGTLDETEYSKFLDYIEKGVPKKITLPPKLEQAVESYKLFSKQLGDEAVKLGILGDVTPEVGELSAKIGNFRNPNQKVSKYFYNKLSPKEKKVLPFDEWLKSQRNLEWTNLRDAINGKSGNLESLKVAYAQLQQGHVEDALKSWNFYKRHALTKVKGSQGELQDEVLSEITKLTKKLGVSADDFNLANIKKREEVAALAKKAGINLPKRLGGETSEGYIKHVVTDEWKKAFPTLESMPPELRKYVKDNPFYQVGTSKLHTRNIEGTINEINQLSQSKTGGLNVLGEKRTVGGIKMFEENPEKIFRSQIEEMAQIKAQQDIVKRIKALSVKSADGKKLQSLIQQIDDPNIEKLSRELNVMKLPGGGQLINKLSTDDTQKMVEKLLKDFGTNGEVLPNLPKGLGVIKNPIFKEPGKVPVIQEEFAKVLNQLSDIGPKEATNPVLRRLDKWTSAWKKMAITNPKFHINNWFGANSNNLIDDAGGTIKNRGLVKKILKGGDEIINFKNGTSASADEVLKRFRESGAISGFTQAEAFNDLKSAKKLLKGIETLSSNVGGSIETKARLTAYVNAMERGLSPSEAIQRVFQIHGNYAPEAMSKFEKDVIKRIIPFYTWAKTSVPYQMQQLWNKTGIYSNIGHLQGIVADEEERKGIPDWLRARILIGTSTNKDGTKTARQLPLSVPDLEMFTDPAKVLLSKLNPLIKIPLEIGQNRGTFFGDTLFDPNKYNNKGKKVSMGTQGLDYLLKQIPLITAGKGAYKFGKAELNSLGFEPNVINMIMGILAGQVDPTGPKNYDPARERYAQQSTQAEMMRNLIGTMRRNGIIPKAK